uniref:Uncharacterized protein n=1 Tax=Plectus sambesii TaxID=2011161 RepID=A0A914XTS8_9BILA
MAYVEAPNMSEFSPELAQKFPTQGKRGSPDDEAGSSGGGGGPGGNGPNGRGGGPPLKRPGNGGGGGAGPPPGGKSGAAPAAPAPRQSAGGDTAWRPADDSQPMSKVARIDNRGGAGGGDQRLRPTSFDGSWQRLSRQTVPLNVGYSPRN